MKRIDILNKIFSEFQMAAQYTANQPASYVEHISKSEAFIQFLEVEDCGSVGGYDSKNQMELITKNKLYDRFLTLIRKDNEYSDLESICGFDVKTLGEFYHSLELLRSKTLDDSIDQNKSSLIFKD